MRKEKKNKHFLHKPVYPGGIKAIRELVGKQLKYPKEALAKKIEGSVYLRYDIDYRGKVIDAKVISSLGHGCDEEAIRVIKLLTFEVAKTRGVRVVFHKNIRIHFKLPPVKKTPKIQVNYNYTSTPKGAEEKKNSPKKSTGYTIRFNNKN